MVAESAVLNFHSAVLPPGDDCRLGDKRALVMNFLLLKNVHEEALKSARGDLQLLGFYRTFGF
jgi:hypothetical protein